MGLARCWDEQNSGLSFSVCKENNENDPSFAPADSFLATGLGITLKCTVKYKVPHLTM